MKRYLSWLGLCLAAAHTTPASAQDAIDVGVLRNSDITVVQKMLYSKKGRNEVGAHFGLMPFDAYTTTPQVLISAEMHQPEVFAAGVQIGGGYSLKNATMRELEGPAYGIVPDAYRYLGSVIGNVQWSPIYAKMNWQGERVYHHDIFLLGGAGLTIEQAFMPDQSIAVAPTVAAGIGARIFTSTGNTIRVQLVDNILLEKRVKTADSQSLFIKQNAAISVGYTMFMGD